MRELTPREIVVELDRHIIGQDQAKRAVAIALRNRWRWKQLPEEIRQRYDIDPSSVHESWTGLFEKHATGPPTAPAHAAPETPAPPRSEMGTELAAKHARVLRLIHAYRSRGHRIADTDPLAGSTSYFPELDPAHYGCGDEDLDRP